MTTEQCFAALENLKEVSSQHGGDLATAITRLTVLAAEKLRNPSAAQRDLSPLQFGEDTERLAKRFTEEAGGDRAKALELLKMHCKVHYPDFRTMPGAPGFRAYDRLRRSRHFPQA